MKEIRILLENCDTITVDSKDVKFLDMEQINKLPQDINIICQTTGQCSRETCTTDRVTLILSKDANLPHREFGVFDETTVFERLMRRGDIVALTIVHEYGKEVSLSGPYDEDERIIGNLATVRKNGKEVVYYVSYDEFEHGFDNKLQTTELDDSGNLVIKIGDFNE